MTVVFTAMSALSGCALYDASSSNSTSKKEDTGVATPSDASGLDTHADSGDRADGSDAHSPGGQDSQSPGDDISPGDVGQDTADSTSTPDAGDVPDTAHTPDAQQEPDLEEPTVGFTGQTCFDVSECDALRAEYQCATLSCKQFDQAGQKQCHISFRTAGEQCADAEGICDLPTLCTGSSAFCAPKRYVGTGPHCCVAGQGDTVVQGQCARQVTCQPIAGGSPSACGRLDAGSLPAPYVDPDSKRLVTFEEVTFQGFDSRVLVVQPGQLITANIRFKWQLQPGGPTNWRVLLAIGMDGISRTCLVQGTHGASGSSYGPVSFEGVEFYAPQEEGIYYLNSKLPAGDNCSRVSSGNAFIPRLTDSTLAVIRVKR